MGIRMDEEIQAVLAKVTQDEALARVAKHEDAAAFWRLVASMKAREIPDSNQPRESPLAPRPPAGHNNMSVSPTPEGSILREVSKLAAWLNEQ